MDIRLIEELRRAEHAIIEDLRTTVPYQRLEVLRQVLSLYDDAPPVGTMLDALLLPATSGRAGATSHGGGIIALPGPQAGLG